MPQTHPAPAIDHPAPTPQARTVPPPAAAELSLEERLTLVNTAMTARLDEAAVAYEVNTAHIETDPVDLADVVIVPLTPTSPTHPQPTPPATRIAIVLDRAHQLMDTAGWCAGALTDEQGAVCLLGAIRQAARGDRGLEADAAAVLLDTIRRRFGDVESVPAFNDAWANGRASIRMLHEAASSADARGI
ncbi:hypothetical protein ACFXMT_51035 [Streptomyces mirabilis]|uniref:DUF6197 family protein n=1 Tax=Streptomyces mirabilis TaxID=68239 RepID=UPI0036A5EEB7